MTCFEWWAFEILALFAGWISITALSSHICLYQWTVLVYMIPLGSSVASSSLTGNYLGENKPQQAKKLSRFVLFFNTVIMLGVVILFWLFKV